MKLNLMSAIWGGVLALAAGAQSESWAAVSAAEAAKLRNDLTPVGAEKAGNKEGTIPAWTGGLSPLVPRTSGRVSNAFPGEKPLFAITAQNVDKYADKLSPGTLAMFKKYPATFRINVFPTHRTAAMPRDYYEATFKSATSAKLDRDAGGNFHIEGDSGGVPFPIPQSGAEAIFNHMLYYVPMMRQTASNYLLQSDGRRILVSTFTNEFARYSITEERLRGHYFAVHSSTTNPPIRAGEQIVGHYYTDPSKDTSWVYLPGQRRVRKLPNSCCDTPTPFSSGIISFDEIALWSGNPYKMDWTLVGKKEVYIPYNSNGLMEPTSADDIFGKFHLNPDHVRWELHRVWVVDSRLRAGERHISPRGTYYLDEDTWQAVLSERYDPQGQLAKVGLMNAILLTESSAVWVATQSYHDLLSGAAYFGNVFNESAEQIKTVDSIPRARVSPDVMAGESVR